MNRQRCCCALGSSILLLTGLFTGQASAMVLGDFDHDGDVDSGDLVHLRACALGAAIAQTIPACADARLDADLDVDLDDFGVFQRCYSDEDNAADPDCGCPSGQTDCSGVCTPTASDNANCGACGSVCAAGSTCIEGICWPDAPCDPDDPSSACYCGPDHPYYPNCCPSGQTFCGGCTNTDTDNANCGACGNVCSTGLTCQNGSCTPCSAGLTWCSGVCTNTAFDTLNCGGCGHVCSDGETCSGGICQSPW